jgi:hypothetical protein
MQFWGCGAGDGAGWAKEIPGFGAEFKTAVRKRYPAVVALHPYGEVLPYAENRLTGQSLLIFQVGSIDGVWQ